MTTCCLTAAAGCLSTTGGEVNGSRTETTSVSTDSLSESQTESGGQRTRSVTFEQLNPSNAPTKCLRFDYSSYATTPVPSPTPTVPLVDADAVTLASAFEQAYLRHWAVTEYGLLDESATATDNGTTTADRPTTVEPTPNAPDYPTVRRETERRGVLQRTADGVVVRLQYRRRIVETGEASRRTVVYYLTGTVAVRAETAEYVTPGPHPTEDGVRLTCAE